MRARMNRKGFIGWVLAALGAGATTEPDLTPSVAHVEPSPPAPPSTRLEIMRAASDAGKTHFYCNRSTLERVVASIDSRFEYGIGFQAFHIEGLTWFESRFMKDCDIWCGAGPHQWDLIT